MADAAQALGSLGSDLAFSVSFSIGRELLDAGAEGGINEDELIACILVLSVVLAALPRTVKVALQELQAAGVLAGSAEEAKSTSQASPTSKETNGLASFLRLLVDVARRISISTSVQLLAAGVRVRQPDRAVRVVSLLSVAVFFLFLESSSSVSLKTRLT